MKRKAQAIVRLLLVLLVLYGAGRLYFQVTGGFTLSNITGMPKMEELALQQPSPLEWRRIETALAQPYKYLGKGCQSYVFESADSQFVLKFLKLQRFKPQAYLDYLTFLPPVDTYRDKKIAQKKEKLAQLLDSWRIAYEDLPSETGVVYMHLPEESSFDQKIQIIDKAGFSHEIDTTDTAFLLQRKAGMLCPTISRYMAANETGKAKELLNQLIASLVAEYRSGFGDNDHALMQNTGVLDGSPIHIDVGQLSQEERFKRPEVYHEELFSKTYKFRIWLSKRYPELERHLYTLLYSVIGPEIDTLKPKLKTVDEGA
ncbi:MAG: hypothetical protein ACK5MA_10005 [Parachlamydiaceae bacterium]